MIDVLYDFRYAWRSLRRSRAFAALAVLTLSAGIGATTALFSVLDRVVLRPLPYPNPDRLVVVHEILPKSATPRSPVNAAHFEEWRASSRTFDRMALMLPTTFTLSLPSHSSLAIAGTMAGGVSEPEQIGGARASAVLFTMLGAPVLHGRLFADDEDAWGHDRVAVLDHGLWLRRFGGDPAVVGRSIRLDGEPYTVIGVLGPRFELSNVSRLYPITVTADRPQIWTPIGLRASERDPARSFMFACIGRLAPPVSVQQAAAELNAMQREIGSRLPGDIDLRVAVVPLQEQLTAAARGGLELLLATAGVVLLAACLNIASLCLARGMARQHEIAILNALGAGRRQLLAPLLAESATLAAAGGILGAAAAPGFVKLIVMSAPVDLRGLDRAVLDGRVLMFVGVVSLLCAMVLGVLPAWRSSAVAMASLKSAPRAVGVSPAGRLASLFVAFEAAASAACVIVAVLLATSLGNVLNVDAGFDHARIVSGELRLPAARYDLARTSTFLKQLREEAAAVPGVVSVGISDRVPLKGEGGNNPIAPEGTDLPRLKRPIASLQLADGAYFRTLGIPLIDGRLFDEADRQRGPVAVVAASAAARIWPGQRAIGKRFRIGADSSPLIEIIGMVGDVRGVSLEIAPRPSIYFPYWFVFIGQASMTVRTAGDPAAVIPALRDVIRRIDPEVAAPAFESVEQIVADSVKPRRFQMNLALLFALTALVLTSLGLYGALSYTTRRRTHEIAVRMALGAEPASIRRTVLVQALVPVGAGLAIGFVIAAAIAPLLRGLLFGISPSDPRAFALTAIVLGTVSAVAGYLPARRASQVDPVVAMRAE